MGIQQYTLTINKNGNSIEETEDGDLLKATSGRKLIDVLEEFGFPVAANQKVSVNGSAIDNAALKEYKIESDVEVTFMTKSEGGL